jgi:hypothetical protein
MYSTYSTTRLLGATVLIVASTAQGQTPERVLMSHAPASSSIAGTLGGRATPQVDAAAAIRITSEWALLGEVDSSFRAEIRGAVATSASGDAEFGAVQNPDRSPRAFVVSLGVRSDQGAILFTRTNGTPLGVGRYRISEPADGADEILALILTGSASRPTGVFRGQSGWLIVTEASERLLAGWFQIDGVGFRAAEPESDDRRVSATGSFSAAAASP